MAGPLREREFVHGPPKCSRAPMYDPKLGRFISEDPIGFAGGDVNLYGYVANSPVNRKDPTGQIGVLIFAGAGLLVAGEAGFHFYLANQADHMKWPNADPKGRQRHCWVNCMSVRYHLGNPAPAIAASNLKEYVNLAQHGYRSEHELGVSDGIGDTKANIEGQAKSLIIWKSCEELCRDCQ